MDNCRTMEAAVMTRFCALTAKSSYSKLNSAETGVLLYIIVNMETRATLLTVLFLRNMVPVLKEAHYRRSRTT